MEYRLSRDVARQIAVGLYRNIGAYIENADPENYAQYKAEFEDSKGSEEPTCPPKKQRKSRSKSR